MSAKSGLGRGFDTLIPKDLDAASLINEGERIQNILTSDVSPNKDQPRTHFDHEALTDLAQSIKRFGIVQPLVVTPSGDNKYSIVAGERRWRAAQIAGLERVPVIVRTTETLERLEVALIENVQRVDLSPMEQAVSIERLHQQFNISYKDIAERLSKAPTTVNNIVRLLQLPKIARNALENGEISEGHARAILALKDSPELQDDLLKQIKAKGWSVRQAEQYVVSHKSGVRGKSDISRRMAQTTPETKQLSAKLNTGVVLKRTAKGGYIEIKFSSDAELEKLLKDLLQ